MKNEKGVYRCHKKYLHICVRIMTMTNFSVVRAAALLASLVLLLVSINLSEASPTDADEPSRHRILRRDETGRPRFIQGDLGTLNLPADRRELGVFDFFGDVQEYLDAAKEAVQNLVVKFFGGTGNETLIPSTKIFRDLANRTHIRFTERIDGLPVDAASFMVHIGPRFNIYAINGEFVLSTDVIKPTSVECENAFDNLPDYIINALNVTWLSDCELALVFGMDSIGHRAWKRTIGYLPHANATHQVDNLYSSVVTGEIVAILPTIFSLSLITKDCQQTTDNCITVSTSSSRITTGDEAVDAAHNGALTVYEYFKNTFGRDSLDDNDLALISLVHFNSSYNNAFWVCFVGIRFCVLT